MQKSYEVEIHDLFTLIMLPVKVWLCYGSRGMWTSHHQTSIYDHVVLFTCGLLLNPEVSFGPFQDSNLAY